MSSNHKRESESESGNEFPSHRMYYMWFVLMRFHASDVLTIVPFQHSSVYIIRLPKRAEKNLVCFFFGWIKVNLLFVSLSFLFSPFFSLWRRNNDKKILQNSWKNWGPFGHIGSVHKSFEFETLFKSFTIFDLNHYIYLSIWKINPNHKSKRFFSTNLSIQTTLNAYFTKIKTKEGDK